MPLRRCTLVHLPLFVLAACGGAGSQDDGTSGSTDATVTGSTGTGEGTLTSGPTGPSTTAMADSGSSSADESGSESGDTDADPSEPFGHCGVATSMFELPTTEGEGIYYDDVQAAFPGVDWSDVDRLYNPAGTYPSLLLGNLPDRDPADPLVIT